ncbi:pentapeptide repeat-containing protein [Mycolicibacterium cosmeticum]|uniref:pentapeptide repeat-containing protein n=1 Tax=Mycolicibacterium cosmeticum TaxID=258533 RepID=UPI0032048AF8
MSDLPSDLTEEERRLVDDRRSGVDCVLNEETIRAAVLRGLLCADQGSGAAHGNRLTVRNAVISGDLAGFSGVKLPSVCMTSCTFEGEVSFDEATFTAEARFDESIFLRQARFAETVFSTNARFDGAKFVDLEFYKATVEGDAQFNRAVFGLAPAEGVATRDIEYECVRFRRTKFKGDAYFRHAHFWNGAIFERARFEGDAHFGAEGGEQDWARDEEKRGAATFHGRASFPYANFDGRAHYKNAAFNADVDFYLATFTGDADFYIATFNGNPGDGHEARFDRANFKGNAEFGGAVFNLRAGFANASFAGDASFCRRVANGTTFRHDADFYEAYVASHSYFSGASFHRATRLERAFFKAGVHFDDAEFDSEAATLNAEGMTTEYLNMRFASPPAQLSLKDATMGTIKDRQSAWPEDRTLTGCAYRRIHADSQNVTPDISGWRVHRRVAATWEEWRTRNRDSEDKMSLGQRIDWLKGEPNGYDPFRYDQMIAAYRQAGDEPYASRMALAKQRERRGTLTLPGKFWGVLQDWLVGYGYRLWLPVVWIAGLGVLGSIIFNGGQPPRTKAAIPDFETVYYTTDLLFPLVNFGHRLNFEFTDWRRWLAFAFMVAGWLLAAAVLAGVQRLWGRDK